MLENNQLFKKYFKTTYFEEYVSGVFSDELDKLGYRNQVVNGWLLNNAKLRVFGQVRTLTLETLETSDERIEKGLGFLSELGPNEVFLVGGSMEYAYFGELMSRLSQEVGLEGVIIEGLTRDSFYTQNIDLPIYSKGYTPKDIKGRGRVNEIDVTVDVDGLNINPGDFVFGDIDALVFIPQDIIDKLSKKVDEAVIEEHQIKEKLNKGVPIKEILLNHKSF